MPRVGLCSFAIASAVTWIIVGGCTTSSVPHPPQSPETRVEIRSQVEKASSPAEQQIEAKDSDLFRDVTSTSGITFCHATGTSPEKPFPAANGSGLAAIDYDLDGLVDLYFATGTPIPLDVTRTAPINRMYRNHGGWAFDEVTQASGLGHNGYSAGLAVGDFDSDGFPDIYIGCYGPNRLYRNLGDGTFEDISDAADVADSKWATSTCFLDYDDDGLLDIFVCNYGKWSIEENLFCGDRERNVRIYCSPTSIEPESCILYHNRGDGTFTNETKSAQLGDRLSRGQGVVAADLNIDGWIDLYVGNDVHPNSLFINTGNGTFRDETESSGAAYDYRGNAQAGMGVDAADINADGTIDLFVTNFQNEYNTLYENSGAAAFNDMSQQRGLAAASIPWIGWGTSLSDFDLDGTVDVVVSNGHVDDNRHLLGQDAPFRQPPLLWKNVGGRFELVSEGLGPYFGGRHVGRGLVVADIDRDGDQDLAITHQDAPPALLMNQTVDHAGDPRTLVLRLIGSQSNRDAIGATVWLKGTERPVLLQVKGGASYLSASETRLFFTIIDQQPQVSFHIRWPDRTESDIGPLVAGREYVVIQSLSGTSTCQIVEQTYERQSSFVGRNEPE